MSQSIWNSVIPFDTLTMTTSVPTAGMFSVIFYCTQKNAGQFMIYGMIAKFISIPTDVACGDRHLGPDAIRAGSDEY